MKNTITTIFILVLSLQANAQNRDTLRFMHYNVLKYGFEWACVSQSSKNNGLKTIFGAYKPDILTVNEMEPSAATIDLLRTTTLVYEPAMKSAPFSNSNGSDLANGLYYNSDKFGHLGLKAIKGNVRDVDAHRLYYKPATTKGDTLDFWFLVAHFKASADYAEARGETAKDIATWLAINKNIQRYMIAGDFNLYSSDEPAWQILTSGSSPRFIDPAGQLTGWNGQSFAKYHTQSPNDRSSNVCAVTGGMDNRFDFILLSPAMASGTRDMGVTDYHVFGNDGVSYNEYLDCDDTRSVASGVCSALRRTSDHLPVVMQMTFPSKAIGGGFTDAPFRAEIWGNPARESFSVQLETDKSGTFKWYISDVLGRCLEQGNQLVKTPGDNFDIAIPAALATGTYFFIVRNAEDKAIMLKFVVLK